MDVGRTLPPAGAQLAVDYAELVKLVHATALDIETGRWAHLEDVAARLSLAADELAAAASAMTREPTAVPPGDVLGEAGRYLGTRREVLDVLHQLVKWEATGD